MSVAGTTHEGWLRGLWRFLLRHRRDLVVALLAALLGSACQAVIPLIARQILDEVIVAGTSPLWPWLLLLLAAAVGTFGFAYLRRYRGGRVALGVQFDLRNAMHDHLQTLDQGTLAGLPTGQLVARANSDSSLVHSLLSLLPIMMGNILMLVTTLTIMIFLSPALAVISVAVLPVLFVLSYRLRTRVFPATWEAQQREGAVAQIVDEDVNGVRVVKAFGQEQRELGRVVDAAGELYGARMRAVRLRARYQPLLEAVPSLAQVLILAVGGWMALRGHLSIGTFLAFSTYVGQFAAPARQLAGVLTVGQQARAGVERIFQLLRLRPAIADAPEAVDVDALRGEIAFEGVEFAYPGGPPVLRGFDLRIAAGERVAIIGASGSGKSTVAALVSRFHDPDAGRVTVDGHDLRSVRLRSLRSQIGVAFEESFLFSASVRDNIGFGCPDASDAEIEAAARAAAAHEFITGLPRGYDTVVGERGLSLSGGQRQRIALARALLIDPRVLLLDDATSAVDAHTEARVHDALRELLPGRTTILIAHRVSTLHLADRIVVLAAGRVAEVGTHDELHERSAAYRTLLAGLAAEQAREASAQPDDPAGDETGDRNGDQADVDAVASSRSPSVEIPSVEIPSARRPARVGTAAGPPRAPSLGAGLGRGSRGGWRMDLTPTADLLAAVAALPPVRDVATVDVAAESRPDPRFSLPALLRRFRRPLLLGLLLVIGDAAAGLAGPVLVRIGVDDGVAAGSSGVLWAASAVFLVVTLADLLDQVGETFVTGRTAERIMLSLRIRIFAQLQRLSLDYYEREMSGRIMTRMTNDVDQFKSLIENGLLAALVSVVTFAGVGAALLSMDLELGGLTLLVIVPLAAATVLFRRRAAALYDQARERIAIVNADFQESVSGIREAQAFVHETATVERFHGLGRDYLVSRVGAQRLVAIYFPFVQFLSAAADAIVLGAGSALVVNGQLSVGVLIAFMLYINIFFSPIQQLSQVFDAWQQTRVSVARIAELMRLETLTPAAERPVVPPRRPRGELVLEGVRFAYPAVPAALGRGGVGGTRAAVGPADARPVRLEVESPARLPEALRQVDLRVAAGETVALVGETGAGKSTVMKLIARFYDPDEGSVRIDGLDLRTLDLGTFRGWLGYVPQEAFLFSGTIRDNIAYGRPAAGDAEVVAAARAVGAHEFITALPGGYGHEVAERGRSLSAGQRQLIALARAELVDPVLLLLDEATSNLDLATEHRVAAAMRQVARRRTTIVIAHRLQTARTADRIVVLDQGTVAEVGSHDELIEADGRYASMWRAFELVGSTPG